MYLPYGAFLEENFRWESQEHYSVEQRIEHANRVAGGIIRVFIYGCANNLMSSLRKSSLVSKPT
jgi:hypothetical protein